jgi:hypothetical protein
MAALEYDHDTVNIGFGEILTLASMSADGITSQVKDSHLIVERVARTLKATREAGVPIIFTRHMSLSKELMGAFAYRMAMAWQQLNCSTNRASPRHECRWESECRTAVNSIRVVHSGPRPEQSFQIPEDLAARAGAAIVYALSRKASRAGVSKATLRCCGPEILPKKLS